MMVSELKKLLLNLTNLYFTEAIVKYSKQSFSVKPKKPLVTLTFGSVNRPLNPPVEIIDGRPVAFYPATIPIQIDLFTQGRTKKVASGYTPVAEDTAEDDLIGFVNFLNSPYGVQWCHQHDISIVVPSTVENLTGLINDTNYEFRAMVEIMVYFTMTAIGYTGTLADESITLKQEPQVPNEVVINPTIHITPSGGGNKELTSNEDSYFASVEIHENKEGGKTL